jgi:hypothetical protein
VLIGSDRNGNRTRRCILDAISSLLFRAFLIFAIAYTHDPPIQPAFSTWSRNRLCAHSPPSSDLSMIAPPIIVTSVVCIPPRRLVIRWSDCLVDGRVGGLSAVDSSAAAMVGGDAIRLQQIVCSESTRLDSTAQLSIATHNRHRRPDDQPRRHTTTPTTSVHRVTSPPSTAAAPDGTTIAPQAFSRRFSHRRSSIHT